MINEYKAKKFCKNYKMIENYQLAIEDKTQTWQCHHRRETDENKSLQELVGEGRYYDVEPEELIFLTEFEHKSIHNKGKQMSKETREKISENNVKYWKNKQMPEYIRKKMSDARKGEKHPMFGKQHSDFSKNKISETIKNKHYRWYNNGEEEMFCTVCPEGFVAGRIKRARKN